MLLTDIILSLWTALVFFGLYYFRQKLATRTAGFYVYLFAAFSSIGIPMAMLQNEAFEYSSYSVILIIALFFGAPILMARWLKP